MTVQFLGQKEVSSTLAVVEVVCFGVVEGMVSGVD